MKTKLNITVEGAEKLNNAFKEANLACASLSNALKAIDRRSIFEKAIDWVSDKLFGGKSCMPNELRSF